MEIFNKKSTKVVISVLLLVLIIFCFWMIQENEKQAYQNINDRFADKMSTCWEEVKGTGQTCELEYIYEDGYQTPVSAKVIKKEN